MRRLSISPALAGSVTALRPFRPEDLYRLRALSDPNLSPDGSRLAWVQSEVDEAEDRLRTSIWVAQTDGSEAARPFTYGPSDHSPRWSPDGRFLAYVSTPANGPAELQLALLTGGTPRRLVQLKGAISQPAWSPDSRKLVVVSPTGDRMPGSETALERNAPRVVRGLAARFDNLGWFDGRRHLFVIDVDSGASHQITRGDYDDLDPAWSPDGTAIVFSSDRHPRRNDRQLRSDVFVVAARGGAARRVTRGEGRSSLPAFSPDGANIAFVGHQGGAAWNRDLHLFVVPGDGSRAARTVAAETDRPVPLAPGASPPFRWLTATELAVLVADQGAVGLHRVSTREGRSTVVFGGDQQIDGISAASNGKTVAFTSSWPDRPSESYVAPLGGTGGRQQGRRPSPLRLSRANDDFLAEVELGQVRRHATSARDGTRIEYFTIRPPGAGTRKLPVQLDIHGGPHGYWPSGRFLAFHQALAAAGYVVVLPNPRGSSGYGQAFTEACTGDWGGADADDLLACVDDVVDDGLGDPGRQFVSGGSYGGFMTAWLIGHTGRFAAATAMAAVIDQLSMFGTSDLPGFVEFNFGLPWEAPEEFELRSPLHYAHAMTTPVLIVHWEGDLRVPIGQGEELYSSLRRLGRPVEFVRYPGGAHITRSPSQNVDWVKRMLEWNKRHEAGSGQPSDSSGKGGRRRT